MGTYYRSLFGLFSVTFRLCGSVVIYLLFSRFIRFTTVVLRIMGYMGTYEEQSEKRLRYEGRSTGRHTRQASCHRAAVNVFELTSMTVLFFRFFDNRMSHIHTHYTCTRTLSHLQCINVCLIWNAVVFTANSISGKSAHISPIDNIFSRFIILFGYTHLRWT